MGAQDCRALCGGAPVMRLAKATRQPTSASTRVVENSQRVGNPSIRPVGARFGNGNPPTKRAQWLEENRKAIAAENVRVDRHGAFGDGWRSF